MVAKSFVVAMAADIARSDYAKPTLIRSRSREWLIACRWGPDGEYLSIATAGVMLDPRGLRRPTPPPSAVCSALVSDRAEAAALLLVRQLPFPSLTRHFLSGRWLRAAAAARTIGLACKTRYSHSRGWLDSRKSAGHSIQRRPRWRRWRGISGNAPQLDRGSFPNDVAETRAIRAAG